MTDLEQRLEAFVERRYSTSYELFGFYVLTQSEMDDLIEMAVAEIDRLKTNVDAACDADPATHAAFDEQDDS